MSFLILPPPILLHNTSLIQFQLTSIVSRHQPEKKTLHHQILHRISSSFDYIFSPPFLLLIWSSQRKIEVKEKRDKETARTASSKLLERKRDRFGDVGACVSLSLYLVKIFYRGQGVTRVVRRRKFTHGREIFYIPGQGRRIHIMRRWSICRQKF